MSSPSVNAADVGILAQNQSHSDDASPTEPKFTSRFDVYNSILYVVLVIVVIVAMQIFPTGRPLRLRFQPPSACVLAEWASSHCQ